MKTNSKFFNYCKLAAVALVAMVGFSACSNDDDNGITGDAYVRIVNAASGSSAQDFYLDSTKVSTKAVAYTESSAYMTTNSGNRLARFKTSGSTTVNSSSNVKLDAGKYYTIYYTGGASANANFVTTDERGKAAAGKAKVRFVHLSSFLADKVNLTIKNGATIVNNLAYKTASAYQEVAASSDFELVATGSNDSSIDLPGLNLASGASYTVYISGDNLLNLKVKAMVDEQ